MVDTLNSASDWHQCAIYKLADWAKLRVLILLFFQLSCVTKNDICAQMLLHKVKQRNKTGMVGKFYTVDVLAVYCTYLPKIINVYLNLPKLL